VYKKKDVRQEAFWKIIEEKNELLQDSEPPIDFTANFDFSERNVFFLKSEVERLSLE